MSIVSESSRSRRGLIGLLSAEAVSLVGTRMSMLAVPWFVLITTGSATRTGLAAFAELAPYVLMQAVGGPVVDKFGARSVSIATDIIAGLGLLAVPLLHAADKLSFAVLLGLLAGTGFVRGAGDIARLVLLPGVQEAAETPMERVTGIYVGVETGCRHGRGTHCRRTHRGVLRATGCSDRCGDFSRRGGHCLGNRSQER